MKKAELEKTIEDYNQTLRDLIEVLDQTITNQEDQLDNLKGTRDIAKKIIGVKDE